MADHLGCAVDLGGFLYIMRNKPPSCHEYHQVTYVCYVWYCAQCMVHHDFLQANYTDSERSSLAKNYQINPNIQQLQILSDCLSLGYLEKKLCNNNINLLNPSGYVTHQQFLTFNNCTLCPHCIYVFCIYLRTNSDLCHLHHKLMGFYNRDEKCLLSG